MKFIWNVLALLVLGLGNAFASNDLLIHGQVNSLVNGQSSPVEGQVITLTWNGPNNTETWQATTGPLGAYEITLVGMSVTGPNRLVIVSTVSCDGTVLSDTVSNNQGTVDEAVVDFVSCETNATNPCSALFTYAAASNTVGHIEFTNLSDGAALSYSWSLNGVEFSTQMNPSVDLQPGTWEICLHVVSGTMDPIGCEDTYCQSITVGNDTPPCDASFAFGVNPNGVYVFEPLYAEATGNTFQWTLGDGTSSDTWHPNHSYADGSYEVCLTLTTAAGCTATACQTVVVGAAPVPCDAAFTSSVSPSNPLRMIYLNGSNTLNSDAAYSWDMGDGTVLNTLHAEHTYEQAGTYTVCLMVQTPNCADTLCQTVVVPGAGSEGFLLSGIVYAGGQARSDAQAWLFRINADTGLPELVGEDVCDANGRYHFTNIAAGTYIVKGRLQLNTIDFSNFAPAWHSDALYWENATQIALSANTDNKHITLSTTENTNGPGDVNGNVDMGPGRFANPELGGVASTNPAVNAEVLITTVAGVAQRWTMTDANGNFSITGLDYGTYVLFADVAGTISQPYEFTLSPEQPSVQIDYLLGDVITTCGEVLRSELNVFPNPALDRVQIGTPVLDQGRIELWSAEGKLLEARSIQHSCETLSLETYPSGLMHVVLRDAQGRIVQTRRLVKP
jgi:PKD repeat protein